MKKTMSEIKMGKDEQKDWSTQPTLVVPQKMPKKVIYNEDTGQMQNLRIGENRVGEETKKYFSPEHHDIDPEKVSPSMTQRIEEYQEAKEEEAKQAEPQVSTQNNTSQTKVVDQFTTATGQDWSLNMRQDSGAFYITVTVPRNNGCKNTTIMEPSNAINLFKSMKLKSKSVKNA